MKKVIYALVLATVLWACNTKESKTPVATNGEPETTADSVVYEKAVPVFNPESNLYIWKSSYDYTKTKNQVVKPEIVNADSLIKGLNELNDKIILEKVRISGDTVYTRIQDAEQLTEGLGTTGAEMYLADVVLNLTEVPGIRYVTIDLKEGSHMQPGTWSKDNFAKYKPVN